MQDFGVSVYTSSSLLLCVIAPQKIPMFYFSAVKRMSTKLASRRCASRDTNCCWSWCHCWWAQLAKLVRTDQRRHTHFAWPTINLQPPATTPTSAHFLLPIPPKLAIMSDGEIEVESPAGYAVLPKEVTDEIGSIKLFNKARPWRDA
jgi:hypothetical protein